MMWFAQQLCLKIVFFKKSLVSFLRFLALLSLREINTN